MNNDRQYMLLSPCFSSEFHGHYLAELEGVLRKGCRNIAVAGPYGSGKSSVLMEYQRLHTKQCITVSLSTLGTDHPKSVEDKEHYIEREVVRQLLYQSEPGKTPKSRYNQLHQSGLKTVIAAFCIISLIGSMLSFQIIKGWGSLENLHSLNQKSSIVLSVTCGIVLAALALSIYQKLARWTIALELKHNFISVRTGDKGASYIDEHFDEILYFFECNTYDTVVFEDLDRFESPLLFERLRELNVMLNRAPRIINKLGALRFIYATKDDIFDSDKVCFPSETQITVPGSERAKFFDYIIAVTPFSSAFNAYDLACEVFSSELVKDPSLKAPLRSAAPYIPDIRVLKTARNEFNDALIAHGPTMDGLGLERKKLLAMILYKCAYPGDYSKIANGNSRLHKLGSLRKEAIGAEIARLNSLNAKIGERDYEEACSKSAANYDEMLRGALLDGAKLLSVTIQDKRYDATGLRLPLSCWRELTTVEPDADTIILNMRIGNKDYSRTLTLRQLEECLKTKLDPKLICESKLQEADRALLSKNVEMIGRIEDLTAAQLFSISGSLPFAGQFKKEAEALWAQGPALSLIIDGLISSDFALYASAFPECGRIAARSFYAHHIEEGSIGWDYPLPEEDCADLANSIDTLTLSKHQSWNYDLLTYLLKHQFPTAEILISLTADSGDDWSSFVIGAITQMTDKSDCVAIKLLFRALSSYDGDALNKAVDLNDDFKHIAVTGFIAGISEKMDYTIKPKTRSYIRSNWRRIAQVCPSSICNGTKEMDSEAMIHPAKVALFFQIAGFNVPDLSEFPLSQNRQFVTHRCFIINRRNLLLLIRAATNTSTGVISLNQMKRIYRNLYDYVVSSPKSLENYLTSLNHGEVAMEIGDEFIYSDVIAISSGNQKLLNRFLSKCDSKATIRDVDHLISLTAQKSTSSILFLSHLANNSLISPSTYNVISLMNHISIQEDGEEAMACMLGRKNVLFDISECNPSGRELNSLIRAIKTNALINQERKTQLLTKIRLATEE